MDDKPLVGIVMGSDSDWPTMEPAAQALREFGIAFEADVVSAHRRPTPAGCAASSLAPVVPRTCRACWQR